MFYSNTFIVKFIISRQKWFIHEAWCGWITSNYTASYPNHSMMIQWSLWTQSLVGETRSAAAISRQDNWILRTLCCQSIANWQSTIKSNCPTIDSSTYAEGCRPGGKLLFICYIHWSVILSCYPSNVLSVCWHHTVFRYLLVHKKSILLLRGYLRFDDYSLSIVAPKSSYLS